MSKYFLINPYKGESDSTAIEEIRQGAESILLNQDKEISTKRVKKIQDNDNLTHVEGKVIIKIDMDYKNSYQFQNGTTIRLERKFNNFNKRETEPVNAIVISGENIPKGAQILIDHKSLHETNRINDYKNSFENEDSDKIRYYSIPDYECFAWREDKNDWQPLFPFEFALRVFKPYEGTIQGIEPTVLKDTLYVTTGELKGNIVKTLIASDYQVIFQGDDSREKYLIRFRPMGDEKRKMEPEAIAIMGDLNKKLKQGELLIGYSPTDAKIID